MTHRNDLWPLLAITFILALTLVLIFKIKEDGEVARADRYWTFKEAQITFVLDTIRIRAKYPNKGVVVKKEWMIQPEAK